MQVLTRANKLFYLLNVVDKKPNIAKRSVGEHTPNFGYQSWANKCFTGQDSNKGQAKEPIHRTTTDNQLSETSLLMTTA